MLYFLPDDILPLVFDKCCTRSLVGIASSSKAFRTVVRIFAEEKLEILRDIVATARTFLPFAVGIATIHELKAICGQRVIVPIKFRLHVYRVARNSFYVNRSRLSFERLERLRIHHLAMEYLYFVLTPLSLTLHSDIMNHIWIWIMSQPVYRYLTDDAGYYCSQTIKLSHVKYATEVWARKEFAANRLRQLCIFRIR